VEQTFHRQASAVVLGEDENEPKKSGSPPGHPGPSSPAVAVGGPERKRGLA
jgi:hypothetical protein